MRSLMMALCVGALAAAGCHDDEVCNPGLTLVEGVCIPALPASDGGDAGATPTDAANVADGNGPTDAGQD